MAMNRKTIFCILYLMVFTVALYAQSGDGTAKAITKIKLDSNYLYAEATMRDSKQASEVAASILEAKVEEWASNQYPNDKTEMYVAKMKEHGQQLQTRRGDFYRAFVYVKKNDLVPSNTNIKSNETAPSAAHCDELFSNLLSKEKENDLPISSTMTLTNEEQRMITIQQFYDIEPYVKELESSGKIISYGKYTTMPENAPCHLFIYNKDGDIVAILRKQNGEQLNICTLQKDEIKNYKNCGAIWIQLRDEYR